MADFPFTLSYHSFGAPGCGGVSRLSVGLTAAGDIAVIDALPSEYDDEEDSGNIAYHNPMLSKAPPAKPTGGREFRRTRIIAAAQGGRGIINYLAQNEIVAFGTDGDTDGEYPWPATMELEGKGWSSGGCRL